MLGLGPGRCKRVRSSGVSLIVIPVCGFRTLTSEPGSRRGVTVTSGARGPKQAGMGWVDVDPLAGGRERRRVAAAFPAEFMIRVRVQLRISEA